MLDFHARSLHVFPIGQEGLLTGWVLGSQALSQTQEQIRWAVGAYSIYSVLNLAIHHGNLMGPGEARRALEQASREAVLGHHRAERALDAVLQGWDVSGHAGRRRSS